MSLEEVLGIINLLLGLFLLVFVVAYFSTKSIDIATATRGIMFLALLGIVAASMVSGFVVLGGALSDFGENPAEFIVIGGVVILSKLVTIVASITGTLKIINARRKYVK